MDRIRCIEKQLGLYLYQYSHDYFKADKIPGRLKRIIIRCPFGNKELLATLSLIALVLFIILLITDLPIFYKQYTFILF